MVTSVLTCDMGLKGGFCLFTHNPETDTIFINKLFPMPKKKKLGAKNSYEIDFEKLKEIFYTIVNEYSISLFLYEKQFVKEGQGYSEQIFGNQGEVVGMARILIPIVDFVRPQIWTKSLGVGANKRKHVQYSNANLPETMKLKNSQDGIADAVCIALYHHKKTVLTAMRGRE